MALERAGIHAQAVFDQHAHGDRLRHAAALGVALLHRDGFLDVLEIGAQLVQLSQRVLALAGKLLRQRLEVGGQLPAASSRRELGDRR